MLSNPPMPVTLHRRRDRRPDELDYRLVRRALGAGDVVRVAPGTFADAGEWRALRPIEQHRVRVGEALERARAPVVLSHFAAAAHWGIDILGRWPERIDTRIPRAGGGRSSGLFRRHAIGIEDIDVLPLGSHFVTTPAQTVIDLAMMLPFIAAVTAADQAAWIRREGGALVTIDQLQTLVAAAGAIAPARTERVVSFASAESDSVRESQSRVLIDRLGFPRPVLQRSFRLLSGSTACTDFYFPDQDHAGEFDGIGKYLDPVLLRGRTPEEVLIAEKDRGDELRRMVSGFSRWRTPALARPRLLYDILAGDGLPSSQPPPPPGAVWR